MKGILLASCCLLSLVLCAQKASHRSKQLAFTSINQALHFEGAAGSAFGVQSVNGITYQGWGAGVGLGLDLYRVRSYPVFLQVRRQVPLLKAPLYLYADAGKNFVWAQRGEVVNGSQVDYGNRLYWDAGLQYQLPLKNETAIVFSAGYSEKRHAEKVSYVIWCVSGNCPEVNSTYNHTFRRLVLKAGFRF